MSLESLLEAVRREAQERIEKIRKGARERASAVVERARTEADERREEHRTRVVREARADAVARLAGVRREARGRVLDARSRGLERTFEAVRGRLPDAVGSDAYRASLPAVAADALTPVEGRDVEIRCAPGLGDSLEEALAEGGDRGGGPPVEEDPDVGSGFRIVAEDGGLVVDASLEAALRRLRPRLSIEVVRSVEGRPGIPTASRRAEGPEGDAAASAGADGPGESEGRAGS